MGRPRCSWNDNVKLSLMELSWDWVRVVQGREMGDVTVRMDRWVP
jgi:hypothetical protein